MRKAWNQKIELKTYKFRNYFLGIIVISISLSQIIEERKSETVLKSIKYLFI